MKTVSKSAGPNALTLFAQRNPDGSWDDFKNENQGIDYSAIRSLLFADQGGLCAYCEAKVTDQPVHKQRVEHFHPKSDRSIPGVTWALDWNNVIGVCIGGEDSDKEIHPLPANLSCDAHKNHLVNSGKLTEDCEGILLNPLSLPPFPCLFKLDKRTGMLSADAETCEQVRIEGNRFETVTELVENTIRLLNLNCDRLNQQRIELLRAYNREVKMAKDARDAEFKAKLARRWFAARWPFLFTTRRILLGSDAESRLDAIRYAG